MIAAILRFSPEEYSKVSPHRMHMTVDEGCGEEIENWNPYVKQGYTQEKIPTKSMNLY